MQPEQYLLLERSSMDGALNENDLVVSSDGRKLIRRIPKDDQQAFESISKEYQELGFFTAGGRYRRRSPQEQVEFTQQAAAAGLRVLLPVDRDDDVIYYPFLEQSKTLDQFLAAVVDADHLIRLVLKDLWSAHKKGIVYGDRWSKNILVQSTSEFVNIDFDLLIGGDCAKEFELAQVVYYAAVAGPIDNIPILAANMRVRAEDIDARLTEEFLNRHVAYFQGSEFCDQHDYIKYLLSVLE